MYLSTLFIKQLVCASDNSQASIAPFSNFNQARNVFTDKSVERQNTPRVNSLNMDATLDEALELAKKSATGQINSDDAAFKSVVKSKLDVESVLESDAKVPANVSMEKKLICNGFVTQCGGEKQPEAKDNSQTENASVDEVRDDVREKEQVETTPGTSEPSTSAQDQASQTQRDETPKKSKKGIRSFFSKLFSRKKTI